MAKATFELEWNDDLSKGWMNVGNLELLMYSSQFTKKELVRVREVKNITKEKEE